MGSKDFHQEVFDFKTSGQSENSLGNYLRSAYASYPSIPEAIAQHFDNPTELSIDIWNSITPKTGSSTTPAHNYSQQAPRNETMPIPREYITPVKKDQGPADESPPSPGTRKDVSTPNASDSGSTRQMPNSSFQNYPSHHLPSLNSLPEVCSAKTNVNDTQNFSSGNTSSPRELENPQYHRGYAPVQQQQNPANSPAKQYNSSVPLDRDTAAYLQYRAANAQHQSNTPQQGFSTQNSIHQSQISPENLSHQNSPMQQQSANRSSAAQSLNQHNQPSPKASISHSANPIYNIQLPNPPNIPQSVAQARGRMNASGPEYGHQPMPQVQQQRREDGPGPQYMVDPQLPQSAEQPISLAVTPLENHNLSLVTTSNSDDQQYCDITEFLTMPQNQAAKRLQIPASTLSKRWKEAAPNRKWPWRTLCKIDKEITTLLHNIPPNGVIPYEIETKLGNLIRQRQEELKPIVIRL